MGAELCGGEERGGGGEGREKGGGRRRKGGGRKGKGGRRRGKGGGRVEMGREEGRRGLTHTHTHPHSSWVRDAHTHLTHMLIQLHTCTLTHTHMHSHQHEHTPTWPWVRAPQPHTTPCHKPGCPRCAHAGDPESPTCWIIRCLRHLFSGTQACPAARCPLPLSHTAEPLGRFQAAQGHTTSLF